MTVKMNAGLEFYTADRVAECLHVSEDLYIKLWKILEEAENPTPLGGDGSNGTVETPDAQLDSDNDDKVPNFWNKLTDAERTEVNAAYAKHKAYIDKLT